MLKYISLLIIGLFTEILIGQNTVDLKKKKSKANFVLDFSYDYGEILNTNKFLNGDNLAQKKIDQYSGFTLKFGLQNSGKQDWQQVYKYPYYGLGLSFYNLKSEEIGNPISTFAYFGMPLWRFKAIEIYGEFQFGFAGNWNEYDSITNPKNISVSTNITAYTGGGIRALLNLNSNLDLGFGFNFKHFSNGGGSLPNKGINFNGSEIVCRYHIQKRPRFSLQEKQDINKNQNEFRAFVNFGQYQTIDNGNNKHENTVIGISALYFYQHTIKYRNGLGLDLNNWIEKSGNSNQNHLSLGVVFQPELTIGNLDLVGGIGVYAKHQAYKNFDQFYQRLGMRYNFNSKISFGFNIRAIDFYLAENIEYQIGYRF
ncbi:MAG: acyloxyacyl hydrolase [Flavobacteriales bacterium]